MTDEIFQDFRSWNKSELRMIENQLFKNLNLSNKFCVDIFFSNCEFLDCVFQNVLAINCYFYNNKFSHTQTPHINKILYSDLILINCTIV